MRHPILLLILSLVTFAPMRADELITKQYNCPLKVVGLASARTLPEHKDVQPYLEAQGVVFRNGASAFYNARKKLLVFRNTQENHDLMEALIAPELPPDPKVLLEEARWAFNSEQIYPFSRNEGMYVSAADLTEELRQKLAELKPGMSRAKVSRLYDENAGLSVNEYIVQRRARSDAHDVGVRVYWRPAEMPAGVYRDPKLRVKWIEKHKPAPKPTDIAVEFSRPIYTSYAID